MVRFAAAVILLAISACMSAEEQLAEFGKNCEAYGFSPATDAYAECVQREAHAYDALCQRFDRFDDLVAGRMICTRPHTYRIY